MVQKFACAAALCAAAVPLGALAQSNVTLYGRLDTSLDTVRTGPAHTVQMNSNASRLGFKGVEDLGGGLNTVFGLEMNITSDEGLIGTPAFRNSYLGFTGGFGAINIGRIDAGTPTSTPLYALVTKNTEFVVHDAGVVGVGTAILNARTRVSNAIVYKSPDYNNLTFRAGHYLNGGGLAETAAGPIRGENDYQQTDLSLNYGEAGGPLGLGVGYGTDRKRGGALLNDFKNKWMVVGSYDFGPVRAWGILDRENFQGGPASRSAVDVRYFGASVDAGDNGKIVANVMTKDVQTNRTAILRRVQAGYQYRLSKRTNLYALFDISDPNNRVANDKIRAIGVGMQHNF